MKPQEIIERLKVLAWAGKLTDTAILAPYIPSKAANVLRTRNQDIECSFPNYDGQITCQDLKEFVEWVELLQDT